MAKDNNLQDFLTDIANAIREKKGTTDKINPQDFATEIANLSGAEETSNIEYLDIRNIERKYDLVWFSYNTVTVINKNYIIAPVSLMMVAGTDYDEFINSCIYIEIDLNSKRIKMDGNQIVSTSECITLFGLMTQEQLDAIPRITKEEFYNLEVPSNYEWVDLGLPSGLLWASTNVGATKPEESGLYFAWGETEGYTGITDTKKFIWDDYKWGNDRYNLTKYTDPKYGYISPEDDAAYQSDNTCRMPTEDEWNELATYTIITQQTLNGVNGLSFTSKVNGNSIFVAATGIYQDGEFKDYGQSCFLWTANYTSLGSASFATISIDGSDLPFKGVYSLDRCSGYNIRAVKIN